jgi:hypothetical protein
MRHFAVLTGSTENNPGTGRHPGRWRRDRWAVATGEPHRADRIRRGRLPGRPIDTLTLVGEDI